jgi:hypothetical protein
MYLTFNLSLFLYKDLDCYKIIESQNNKSVSKKLTLLQNYLVGLFLNLAISISIQLPLQVAILSQQLHLLQPLECWSYLLKNEDSLVDLFL